MKNKIPILITGLVICFCFVSLVNAEPICEDGVCVFRADGTGENCKTCPKDCSCPSGFVCDPSNPNADDRGCVGSVCEGCIEYFRTDTDTLPADGESSTLLEFRVLCPGDLEFTLDSNDLDCGALEGCGTITSESEYMEDELVMLARYTAPKIEPTAELSGGTVKVTIGLKHKQSGEIKYITMNLEIYPPGWSGLNNPQRKGDVMKVVEFIRSRADQCKSTDPKKSNKLSYYANSLLNTKLYYKKEANLAYKKLAGGTPIAYCSRWGTITLYQPAFDYIGTARMNLPNNPDYIKYMAEVASVLIHELTHKDGGDEIDAYSTEYDLFKYLGVKSNSQRYKDVIEHLTRLGKGWKSGYSTFDDKWAEIQP